MLINPILAIAVFVIIIIIALLIARSKKSYKNFNRSTIHSFVVILGGLGIFVSFMFYYNVVEIQNKQQKAINSQELSRINTNVSSILGDKYIKSIPIFVYSINPLLKKKVNLDHLNIENSHIQMFKKHSLSQIIFNSWDDFRSSKRLSTYDEIGVINTFLQKCDSAELLEEWEIQKYNFDNKTQMLGNMMFFRGQTILNKTSDSYFYEAKKLVKNQEYINLLGY